METVLKHMSGAVRALQGQHAFYALAELTSTRADDDLAAAMVEGVLAEAFEAGEVEDAVIAASEGQSQALWKLREDIFQRRRSSRGGSIKHDVSVPVSPRGRIRGAGDGGMRSAHAGPARVRLRPYRRWQRALQSQPAVGMDKTAYLDTWEDFNRIVHDIVVSYVRGPFPPSMASAS